MSAVANLARAWWAHKQAASVTGEAFEEYADVLDYCARTDATDRQRFNRLGDAIFLVGCKLGALESLVQDVSGYAKRCEGDVMVFAQHRASMLSRDVATECVVDMVSTVRAVHVELQRRSEEMLLKLRGHSQRPAPAVVDAEIVKS